MSDSLKDQVLSAIRERYPTPGEKENTDTAATAETEVDTTTNDGVEKSAEAAPETEVAPAAVAETTGEEVQVVAADETTAALVRDYGLSPEDVQGLDPSQLQIVLDKFSISIGQRALQAQLPPAQPPVEQVTEKPAAVIPDPKTQQQPTAFDTLIAKLVDEGVDESVIAVIKAQQERVDSLEQRITGESVQRQQEESQRRMSQDEYTLLSSIQTLDDGGKLYGTNAARSEAQTANVGKVAHAVVSLQIAEAHRTGRQVPITPELVKRAHAVAFPNRKQLPTVERVKPQAKMQMGPGGKASVAPKDVPFTGKVGDTSAYLKIPAIAKIFQRARERQNT